MAEIEKKLSNWQKIKKLRYNLLAVPKEGSGGTRVYKIDLYKFVIFFIALVVIAHFIFLALLIYTPIRNYLPGFNIITHQESKELIELKKKLEQINIEFEKVKSINYRLNLLIQGKPIPADKRLYDSLYMKEKYIQDSIELFREVPFSNNVNKVFKDFIRNPHIAFIISKIANIFPSLNSDTVVKGNNYFIFPVDAAITQGFMPERGHNGIDFGVKRGTVVRAAASGVVIFADFTTDDGYKIIISHYDNYVTIYKHLSVITVKEREVVKQSDVIALSGNSGALTTNPHLHFEIWKNNIPVNPKTICVNINEH